MNSPGRGGPHRQKELFNKVRILKMDSPEGETPQTEITLQTSQDSENGFPQRGDPTDRKTSSKKSLAARQGSYSSSVVVVGGCKLAVTPSSIEAGVLR